jgi:hypothetical protein
VTERQKSRNILCFDTFSRPAYRLVCTVLENVCNYVIMRYHHSFLFSCQSKFLKLKAYAYWESRSAARITQKSCLSCTLAFCPPQWFEFRQIAPIQDEAIDRFKLFWCWRLFTCYIDKKNLVISYSAGFCGF